MAVFHEFERLHQTHAADVADERIFFLEAFEPSAEMGADGVRILEEIFFFNHLNGGARGDGADRIAAERGNRQALIGIGQLVGGDGQPDGHAVGKTLGAGDDVRRDFPLFDAEPFFAGAAPGRLDFVGDEQAAILFYDLEHNLEIFRRRSDESADALNGLGDKSGNRAAGAGLDQVLDVIGAGHAAIGIGEMQRAAVAIGIDGVREAHADDSGFAPGSLSGGGFGKRRAAGIGVAQGHDVVTAGGDAGEKNGGFVGLGAGVGEEAFLELARSDLRELFGECHDLFIGIERRGVLQAVHLRLDLARDFRVAVADRNREDASEEVEITPAFEVPEILHLAVVGDQGLLVEIGDRGPEEVFVLANDLFAAGGGWFWLSGHGRNPRGCQFTLGIERPQGEGNRDL